MAVKLIEYKALKEAGKLNLKRKSHDVVEMEIPRFDPLTGKPVEPQKELCSISQLEDQVEQLQSNIDDLNEFIATLKAAEKAK